MVYFDNAATGGFKPRAVTDAVNDVTRYLCANPGRSAHRLSITGANIVYQTRQAVADYFGCQQNGVIFTKNCTEAINLALFGFLKKGQHVITTVYEHNSILRPLTVLKERGIIDFTVVDKSENQDILSAIKNAVKENTALIAVNALSNVTGEVLPVREIGEFAKAHQITFLVDGAQGGGHIPLSIKEDNVDMLALAGHKGLYAIMGIGALLVSEKVTLTPLLYGGTGTDTFNLNQPLDMPEGFEAGTLNLPAVASLYEGVTFLKNHGRNFHSRLIDASEYLINALNKIDGLTCFSAPNPAGIVSFSLKNLPSAEASDLFNKEFDIAVRGGYHCAPLIHKKLKSDNQGLIRVSLAVQNTSSEIDYFIRATQKIATV